MRKIERLLDKMVAETGDVERTNAGFDWAEKNGDVITVWGVGGTTWKMHWLGLNWYWERDRMATHPADQETERIIKELCKEGLYER